jgi:hypothetical protein
MAAAGGAGAFALGFGAGGTVEDADGWVGCAAHRPTASTSPPFGQAGGFSGSTLRGPGREQAKPVRLRIAEARWRVVRTRVSSIGWKIVCTRSANRGVDGI